MAHANRSLWRFSAARYWPTWLLLLWMRAVAIAPVGWTIRLHKLLGRLLAVALKRRARTARRNLELCFPELSGPEIDSLLTRHFEALGACLGETAIAWFTPPRRLRGLLEVEGLHHVEAALDDKRGVLLFTGHFTALEVTGPLLAVLNLPLAFMFSHRNNALLDEIQARRRARIAVAFFPRNRVRAMLRSLRQNCVVWYAADQYHRGSNGRLVRFFHEPAMTNTAISRLARLSAAPVVPFSYRRRSDDAAYVLTFHAPLDDFPSGDPIRDTRRLVEYLERAVRAAPEQYLWNHKRYRGRPAPLPDVYARPASSASGSPRSASRRSTARGGAAWRLGARLARAVDRPRRAVVVPVHRARSAALAASGALADLCTRPVTALAGTRIGSSLLARVERVAGAVRTRSTRFTERLASEDPPCGSLFGQLMRGLCIGATQLVPGVSGGSAAFLLGVYQRLLRSIARLDAEWVGLLLERRFAEAMRRVDILFVAPIVLGFLAAPVIFSRAVPLDVLIAELPEMTYGVLFGFIAASIISSLSNVNERGLGSYGWLVAGVALGCSAAFFVPTVTPSSQWFLFLCGLITVAAMLMPGLSGALVLLILGKYAETIDALARFDLAFLLPLAMGAIAGAMLFSKLVTWLLERHRPQTMLAMVGVLGGSLLVIWPFQEAVYLDIGGELHVVGATPYWPQTLDPGVLMGTVMMFVGALAYRLLERAARTRSTHADPPRG